MTEIVPCKCGADGWLIMFASLPVKIGVECRKCGNVTKPMPSTEEAIAAWNEMNTEHVTKSQIVTNYDHASLAGETSMEGKQVKNERLETEL